MTLVGRAAQVTLVLHFEPLVTNVAWNGLVLTIGCSSTVLMFGIRGTIGTMGICTHVQLWYVLSASSCSNQEDKYIGVSWLQPQAWIRNASGPMRMLLQLACSNAHLDTLTQQKDRYSTGNTYSWQRWHAHDWGVCGLAIKYSAGIRPAGAWEGGWQILLHPSL